MKKLQEQSADINNHGKELGSPGGGGGGGGEEKKEEKERRKKKEGRKKKEEVQQNFIWKLTRLLSPGAELLERIIIQYKEKGIDKTVNL